MTTAFQIRSQAGQDALVFELMAKRRPREQGGSFLEIGTNNPVERNNTYSLEVQCGWRGLLCDNSAESRDACAQHRKSPFLFGDATKIDWRDLLLDNYWATNDSPRRAIVFERAGTPHNPKLVLDYGSFDIDEPTLDLLRTFPLDAVRFRVITVEHDAYRFGEARRDEMVDILEAHGYTALCKDVQDRGLSFEAWFVDAGDPEIRYEDIERFARDRPTDWQEILR